MNEREKLEQGSYESLGAMMQAYAETAVRVAKEEFKQKLDFSEESIEVLEEILAMVAEKEPGTDMEYDVRIWGGYFGEVLRRRYAGEWEMTQYPGGVASVPALDVRGSRLFPLMKVYRRLTMGESEEIGSFFHMVTGRLGGPSQVN